MRRRLFLAGLASTTAAPAVGHEASAIKLSDYGLPFVPADVAGRPAVALIDTGSARTVQLSTTLADAAGVLLDDAAPTTQRYSGARPARRGRLAGLSVAGETFRDLSVDVSAGDIEQISAQVRTPFDVILGWPFLKAAGFALDFPRRRFALAGSASAPARFMLPLVRQDLPVVAGLLADEEARFLVDTGAPMSNLDIAAAGSAALNAVVSRPVAIGGLVRDLAFRVKDLTALRDGAGCQAVIGNNLLGGHELRATPGATVLELL